jgi:hypothetical protein
MGEGVTRSEIQYRNVAGGDEAQRAERSVASIIHPFHFLRNFLPYLYSGTTYKKALTIAALCSDYNQWQYISNADNFIVVKQECLLACLHALAVMSVHSM